MLRSVFFPSRHNLVLWITTLYLLILLYTGKISGLTVLFVYFLETIIIGLFNIVKIYLVLKLGEKEDSNSILKYWIIVLAIMGIIFI